MGYTKTTARKYAPKAQEISVGGAYRSAALRGCVTVRLCIQTLESDSDDD